MKAKERKTTADLFQCTFCSKSFKYDSDKKRHEESHSPHFKCDVCFKKFSFKSALRRHQKQHDRTGNAQCDICNKTFRDGVLLLRHMKYAHEGTYTCTKCDSTFSSAAALSIHMKTHKPVNERIFQCNHDGCRKVFNFSHHLKHHMLTHTTEKLYHCVLCGKGFIQAHHYKTHLKSHDPAKLLYCTFKGCDKKFTTEFSRKRHLAKHKNNSDSGISSDTNSNGDIFIETESANDFNLHFSSRQLLLKEDNETDLTKHITDIEIYNTCENILLQLPESEPKEDISLSKIDFHDSISTCKATIGSCLMNTEENCLCEQISSKVDEEYELTPFENTNDSSKQNNNFDTNKQTQNNICDRCECSAYKKSEELKNICPNSMHSPVTIPEIENRLDGIIKIKETFDIDIAVETDHNSDVKLKNEIKLIPYNSCKAVLGNCIVSGDGMMGEGCLCAKMAIDESQIMEQEFDDITPLPNVLY